MAKRKFEALADFRRQPLEEAAEREATAPVAAEPPAPVDARPAGTSEPVRGRGRPPGKRSNPQWKLYSHFLKKQTQREAAALLAEREDGRDLSDVLQALLEKWLAEQRA